MLLRSSSLLLALILFAAPARALEIQLNPGAGLVANPEALAAFDRAATQWERLLLDPITIVINADLADLGPGVIGDASSTMLFGDDFAEIRDAMVADAIAEGGDPVVEALPTFAQLQLLLPAGRTAFDSLTATQANLKALGFTGLEAVSGHVEDAIIRFSSNFTFDFDNRDGVDFFSYDFETAAAHEIGHALGFLSVVDFLDQTTAAEAPVVTLNPLDLYRFRNAPGFVPTSIEEFVNTPRSLIPGEDEVFSDTEQQFRFATGFEQGDGNQASHWKNDDFTGQFIGLMDPTLNFGTVEPITQADLRAMDVIGYEVVPEPSVSLLLASAGIAFLGGRRFRKAA